MCGLWRNSSRPFLTRRSTVPSQDVNCRSHQVTAGAECAEPRCWSALTHPRSPTSSRLALADAF